MIFNNCFPRSVILYTAGKTAIEKLAKEGLDRERVEHEALEERYRTP
jgi:hypothetical protein